MTGKSVAFADLGDQVFIPLAGEVGIGKEGPRYAIEEMTETKTVVFHGVGA